MNNKYTFLAPLFTFFQRGGALGMGPLTKTLFISTLQPFKNDDMKATCQRSYKIKKSFFKV